MKGNGTVQKIRKDLPFLEGIVYLDSASVSPAPIPVVQSGQNARLLSEKSGVRIPLGSSGSECDGSTPY